MAMKLFVRPLAVFFVSLIFFLVDFDLPSRPVFDETHYLPAAHAIWNLQPNNNYEHPPLAKELMGLGAWATGMDLNGARLASVIFGALACVAFFMIARTICRCEDWALLAVVLAWLNGLTFVLSRLAMLEIFLSAFMLWSVYFFLRALKTGKDRDAILSALCMGAAVACKWYALIPWLYLFCAALWFGKDRRLKYALFFALLPVLVYAATYIPLMMVEGEQYSPRAFLQMQGAMYEAQRMNVPIHPEYSMWWTWPFKLRPMWFMRDTTDMGDGKQVLESVILLGNPLILWIGVLSLFYMASEIHRRAEAAIAPLYLALLLPWILIPRVNTFYYYYFPLAWLATLAAADTMRRFWNSEGKPARILVRVWLAAAACVFFYHWPLYSGWKLPRETAESWYPYLF